MPVSPTEFRLFQLNVGLLGASSFTKQLQKFVHNDLDLGIDPQGWDTQNPTALAIDIIYGHTSERPISSIIGKTTAVQTYGIRFGNVVIEAFLDQQINKQFYEMITLFAGLEGHLKYHDTHLEGRLFRDNIYTVEMEKFVAAAKVGIEVELGTYDVGFKYALQTPTFLTQTDNHAYGSFYLKRDW